LRTEEEMNRSRPAAAGHDRRHTRIVWRDGPFRVECTGGASLTLSVYYGGAVLAEEAVPSAEAAWERATEICRRLDRSDLDAYKRGFA
jgi:hypothetical protein